MKKQKHVRSARTGRYTRKTEAKRHPSTTVTETDKMRRKKR